jgi:hypothetical protein
MEEMNISFGSFYKRASFWRNRKKMNKRGCGARPRGVAEFTKTVAEFTKSSLAGKKLLQVSKILLIFVVRLLHTNDINTI